MSELLDRKQAAYARRALDMRKEYNMKWSRRDTFIFIQRLMDASCVEGVDDKDLRVLVRLYNRELIGRSTTNG